MLMKIIENECQLLSLRTLKCFISNSKKSFKTPMFSRIFNCVRAERSSYAHFVIYSNVSTISISFLWSTSSRFGFIFTDTPVISY